MHRAVIYSALFCSSLQLLLVIHNFHTIKAVPVQARYKPRGFQEVEAPRIRDNRRMSVESLSVLPIGRLYPQEIFVVHIFYVILTMLLR